MALTEQMVEVLEALWTLEEKGQATCEDVIREAAAGISHELLEKLHHDRVIIIQGSGRVNLAPEGRRLAEQIIRRHRLAERLICDVLGAKVDDSEAAACEFEHLLAEGITNSICTLLGHPRLCPHNRPIPKGECCRQDREELKPIVIPCNQLGVGESARIAYFCTAEHARLLKLSSLGLTPGGRVKLLQKWPSFVLQVEETEIALEEDVARNIYVRR
jgi:DtxR family Mn-dependent transcriptional regulator